MSATPGPPGHRPPDALPPEFDPRGRRRARALAAGTADRTPVQKVRVGARRVGGVTRVLAAVLSLAILVGSGWAWASYKKFDGAIAEGQALPTGGTDVDGRDQNILLVGNDSRAGATPAELAELSTQDDGGSANTDTMILLHVPADGSTATMVSFPRDSYVDIPGYGTDRINAAYPDAYTAAKAAGQDETAAQGAGLALTAATVSELTGLHVDHYLQVNLLGFYRISKAVGGVQVCLNAAMTPGTDGDTGIGLDSGYENDEYVSSYSGIDLPAGVSTVEGKQALAFVRQRHGLPNGDLDRVVRQQYFLKATFAQVKSLGVLLNPFKLNELLDAVSSSLLKDPALNLLDLAGQMQGLATGNITSVTMVTEGYDTVDGKDVLTVDPAAVKAQMSALIGTPAQDAYEQAATVDPAGVTVSVLNGSDVGGAAATTADRLRGLGFQVPDSGVGNADPSTTTTIRYPDGLQAQAKTLAAQVPGAQVTVDAAVQAVTLVLGSDGVGVGAAAAPVDPATAAPPAAGASSGTVANAPANGLGCVN